MASPVPNVGGRTSPSGLVLPVLSLSPSSAAAGGTVGGAGSVSVPSTVSASATPCAAADACPGIHPGPGGPYVTEWFNTTIYASVTPSDGPPPMLGSSMAYDPGNSAEGSIAGTVVLFGGIASWGATNYTYVGIPATVPLPDGQPTASVVWVNITHYLLRSPSPRYYAAMTYDAHDGYLLLYGGEYAGINAALADTWTLSVIYQGEIVNPPPQPATFKFLLFGWSPAGIGGNHPPARAGAGLAYDAVDGYAVLFGGYNDPTYFSDTWTYSAGVWTPISPAPSPYARAFAGFVWDAANGYALLLPGLGGSKDTWGFVHGLWTPIASSTPTGPRWAQSIAYDDDSGNVTVFGGVNTSTMATYSDTWNWSKPPPMWAEVDSYGPVDRGAAAMAYDAQIGCSVLFGGSTTGVSGELDDTWLLCTWPLRIAPFTLTLVAHPGVTDRPQVRSGGNATFTVTPAGGTWPYYFVIRLWDGPEDSLSIHAGFFYGPTTVTFTFPISANYLVSAHAVDYYDETAHANLTYPVGTLMVTDWQPLWESYPFSNYGSPWSSAGNCFGFSTTMILYWQHDIRNGAETPYLPVSVWTTANLTAGPPVEPDDGPGMDGATLAIMLHQTVAQGVSSLGGGGGTAPSDFAANWAALDASLAAGQPAVLIMYAPHAGHAVVAYGEQTLPGDVFEIDVSDPNAPQTTEHGFYNASNDSFWWTGPAPVPNFDQFGVLSAPIPLTLAPNMFSHAKWTSGNSNDYDTQANGYYFVAGLAPLTVSLSGGGTDSFGDGGTTADSQTFVQGIANSSGIEEPDASGTLQAFALVNLTGNTYTVTDPASGSSPILALLATNASGTSRVRGLDLNLTSPQPHDFSLRLEPDGTVLDLGAASAELNISFGQLVGTTSDSLNATGLVLPADAVASFHVLHWAGLASATVPAVEVQISTDNGTGPTTRYTLTNGQTGLGTGTIVSYPVTFEETGLPSGTSWSVRLNSSALHSTGASLVFNATNGTYGYTASSAGDVWAAPPGSVSVNGGPVTVSLTFHLVEAPVTFVEAGLPATLLAKDGWTVVLNGSLEHSVSGSITFPTVPNGTEPVLVTGPSGYTSNGSGTVSVSGATMVSVGFSRGHTVTLRFVEKGLPRGQSWSASLNRDRVGQFKGSTLIFANLTPGSYSYAIVAPLVGQTVAVHEGKASIPLSGTLDLTKSAKVSVTFVYPYRVTFTESGLASGTWSITVKGETRSNVTGEPIQFALPNGTYAFKIGTEAGYSGSASPSKVHVKGGPAVVGVTFKPRAHHDPFAGGASGTRATLLSPAGRFVIAPRRRAFL